MRHAGEDTAALLPLKYTFLGGFFDGLETAELDEISTAASANQRVLS
jgi:hypothetical protein